MKKTSAWTSKDWRTFTRLLTGGVVAGGAAAAGTSLMGQFRALRDAAEREANITKSVTRVPLLRRRSAVVPAMAKEAIEEESSGETLEKNAFGPVGGWGLGAALVGGVQSYGVVHKLLQKLRKVEEDKALEDAEEGYNQRLLEETEALQKSAAVSGLAPAHKPSNEQLLTWALWAGLPVSAAMSMFGVKRLLDKAFPTAQAPMRSLDKPVIAEVKELDSIEENMSKEAAVAVLPLVAVLAHPDRVKSSCSLQPWITAFQNHGQALADNLLVKKASMGDCCAGATPSGNLVADLLAGYALMKDASLAPAFMGAVASEFMELYPHLAHSVLGSKYSPSLERELVKSASMFGVTVLADLLNLEFAPGAGEDGLVKSAVQDMPIDMALLQAVKQTMLKKPDALSQDPEPDARDSKPAPDGTHRPSRASNPDSTDGQNKMDADQSQPDEATPDPVDDTLNKLIAV